MGCSVMIIARNETQHIADCIRSCALFADEVVVIDDFSTDDTREKALAVGATVYQRALNNNFGEQQNFGIQHCHEDWLFLIDADERCSEVLAKEIQKITRGAANRAYWVRRINHFNREALRFGPLGPDKVLRLLPRQGAQVQGRVHQSVQSNVPEDRLKADLLHYTYDTWSQYEAKMNHYSSVAAQQYFEQGKKTHRVWDLLVRPTVAFLKMYFFKLGFVEGLLGLSLSRQYANYTMAKYIKLAELNQRLTR